ncbi:hypothetical protein LG634_17150 [Streptomyces bambusae]|uniref:hypothetical protein n=1 Tax=Streptomyces bambusae TaxID=1550616 RepID=UPI001CFEF4DC|nr:hypothetical protein [Streptomyces bambusae]MCB5166557.1 hypothetical protein [Streptomyces bambusae]
MLSIAVLAGCSTPGPATESVPTEFLGEWRREYLSPPLDGVADGRNELSVSQGRTGDRVVRWYSEAGDTNCSDHFTLRRAGPPMELERTPDSDCGGLQPPDRPAPIATLTVRPDGSLELRMAGEGRNRTSRLYRPGRIPPAAD